ncbi:hypothetical protein CQ062_08315 [Ochrobactrum sp. MYb68]|nr:hypothetical protein CQ062_08315 [Ochrobactrum sp. MYb68]
MANPIPPLHAAFNGRSASDEGKQVPQKQMASVAGGGATDAIIVRPELGGGETGPGIAKLGRRTLR